ncbi:23S rRNA (adenine(2503)-C(2))-methyltransferase RlmN, partial [Candidatus Omnitrophota bacterium]
SGSRKTICLSTQVGCKFGCAFCASGLKGFKRDLSSSEIIDQILLAGSEITNFVFMGMGEPLDNFENVKKAIETMNSSLGMAIGARRITVSTCGIIPGIKRFEEINPQINLSISLHAANNKLRNSLMPINKRYPLEELIEACNNFSGRTITLEYILIKDKNDLQKDADELSLIARKLKAKVNLIPYSPVPEKRFKAPSGKDIELFQKRLVKNSVNVTVRESKGRDIFAACGQLAMKNS